MSQKKWMVEWHDLNNRTVRITCPEGHSRVASELDWRANGNGVCEECKRQREVEAEALKIDDRQLKWDRIWLKKAKDHALECSKDPSTKTGAVIVGPDNDLISVGYNGFARGVDDDQGRYANRDIKYEMVVHCEVNAIVFADRWRLKGATLYTWPFMSCSRCAAIVIQAGIKRCVAPVLPPELEGRWGDNIKLSKMQFEEAGVELCLLDGVSTS